MSSVTMKLERILLTYLHLFMVTIGVFFDAEAGAYFIDLPYTFLHDGNRCLFW
jgi:hypothetical protein